MARTNPTGLDAYKPGEISALVERAGVAKARLNLVQTVTLAVLAGIFIGIGAAAYTVAMTGTDTAFGPARILGGVVFSVGLILVVVAGAELFTGNALMVMAVVDRRISLAELGRNWVLVYLGNAAGGIALAVIVAGTGLLDGPTGIPAARFAEGKAALDPGAAFLRGVLCNVLVCLAVWISLSARTVAGKVLAIVPPIASFVALGFEHSIANFYFFPQGIAAGANVTAGAVASNLFFVTIGNIVGGAGGVALAYRLAYGPPAPD